MIGPERPLPHAPATSACVKVNDTLVASIIPMRFKLQAYGRWRLRSVEAQSSERHATPEETVAAEARGSNAGLKAAGNRRRQPGFDGEKRM